MSEFNNESIGKSLLKTLIITIVIIAIIAAAIYVFYLFDNPQTRRVTTSDIKGNWTDDLTTKTFTFIPSKNIKGLELRFTIYDSNRNSIQTIYKTVGDVKRGQQYTVTIGIAEYNSQTLWNGSYISVEVSKGTV